MGARSLHRASRSTPGRVTRINDRRSTTVVAGSPRPTGTSALGRKSISTIRFSALKIVNCNLGRTCKSVSCSLHAKGSAARLARSITSYPSCFWYGQPDPLVFLPHQAIGPRRSVLRHRPYAEGRAAVESDSPNFVSRELSAAGVCRREDCAGLLSAGAGLPLCRLHRLIAARYEPGW